MTDDPEEPSKVLALYRTRDPWGFSLNWGVARDIASRSPSGCCVTINWLACPKSDLPVRN